MQETSSTDDYNPSRSEPHTSKKRKMDERVVVCVKIKEHDKKQHKTEGPPSDCWSWRKYGQKPIKGSPFPRGYYKCSTSKGCSAKKQVERCKIDSSMLIITYTSTHNHPDPSLDLSPKTEEEEEEEEEEEKLEPENSAPNTPKQAQETQVEEIANDDTDDQFHYSQSPFNSSQDHIMVNQEGDPFSEAIPSLLYNENVFQPLPHDPVSFSSLLKPEEYELYDELEELPTSSFFMEFIKSSFCEERIPVNPA